MATTIKISEDVLDVLRRSTITDTSLKLPPEKLEPTFYKKVDKVLKAAGGKWSRSHGAHLFPGDPREILGLAIESGAIANQKQEFQEFFTPPELARQVVDLACINFGDRVLEPSAGHGALASLAENEGCRVICCEIQPKNVAVLRENPKLIVWEGDFLQFPHDMLRPMDVVVMNPPFSGGQDRDHVRHAFEFLCDGGRLVAVMSASTVDGSTKDHKAFREWVDSLGGEFTDVEAGAFKESGTGVRTVILKITKR